MGLQKSRPSEISLTTMVDGGEQSPWPQRERWVAPLKEDEAEQQREVCTIQ
jgi:hypothetical protein